MHAYLTEILNIPDAHTAEVRLDLGFHLTIIRRLGIGRIRVYHDESANPAGGTATEITPSETAETAETSEIEELDKLEDLPDLLRDESFKLLATTRRNSGSGWSADLHLVPANLLAAASADADADANAPVNRQSQQHENTPPALWRYRAEVGRVIDGDTIDAVIDVGFGIEVTERLRFKGIQTPEIFGKRTDDPSYQRGMEAKHYVERRLAENHGRFQVTTSKRGKWRRWLADLHLPDAGRTLNQELIDQGLASDYDSWIEERRRSDVVRTAFDIGRDVREKLTERAKADGRTPAQLLRHIVERFLNVEPGT